MLVSFGSAFLVSAIVCGEKNVISCNDSYIETKQMSLYGKTISR
jgi:hypothetical protein